MKCITFAFIFQLFCFNIAYADPQIGALEIGMPIENISGIVKECEKDLCGDILFGGQTWSGRYIVEEDTLMGIGIYANATEEYLNAVFLGLQESPYVLIYSETDASAYNFLVEARSGKNDEKMEEEFQLWLEETTQKPTSYALYLYAELELYNELKILPSSALEAPLESDMPDVVLTLLSVTPSEIRLLSGTMGTLDTRLKEVQEQHVLELLAPFLPQGENAISSEEESESE